MKRTALQFLTFGLFVSAAAARGRPMTTGTPQGSNVAAKESDGPRVDLTEAIRKLSSGGEEFESFSVEVTWRRDKAGSVTLVKIFGSGVGIWKNSGQFHLSHEQVLAILRRLDESGFGMMQEQFGEDLERGQALQMKGRVVVRLGGETKRVTQLVEGPQSAPLERLARDILDSCEQANARESVTASSLPEGLRKVLAGELAPETVQVYVQRIVEHPSAGAAVIGWMFHSEGRQFVLRERSRERGYGVPVRYRISPQQFKTLVRTLAESDPASFPANLFAPDYTDLSVRVLDQGKTIQARRYFNVTPQTHGETQKRFDALFAEFDALRSRGMKEGTPTPGAD